MLKNLNIEDLETMRDIGIYPCGIIREPIGHIVISHGNKMKITRKVAVYRCFSETLAHYEIKMFNMDMSFFSYIGLTGQQIYNICEDIYIES